ncbi:MAG: NADH-quinone oxidoreductase subunit A [Planctomycetes bacterium]|nr:NADH-quinone oxidoreductase subunit A [Planctomycetota bacterium]
MVPSFWPILAYAGFLVGLGGAILLISHLLGPRRHQRAKHDTYECGVAPVGTARERFPVRFYLVAILFVLFDIETVFLVPWAVTYRRLGVPGLIEMFSFIAVLGIGLYYVWRRGALEWD